MSDLKGCSLALLPSRLCCVMSHDHPDTTKRALNGRVVIACVRGRVHFPQSLVWTKWGFKHLHSDCSHVLWNFVFDLENTLLSTPCWVSQGLACGSQGGGEVFTWRMKLPVSNSINRGSNASADVAKKRRQEPVSQNDGLCQEDGSKVQKGLLWEGRNTFLEAVWNKTK